MSSPAGDLAASPSVWPEVLSSIQAASVTVSVGARTERGVVEMTALQAPASTHLGAVILESSGMLVDDGWLRVLGAAGNDSLSIAAVNGLLPETAPLVPGALLVAWDVVGGLFAINDRALPGARGTVHYFGPDTLQWLDTGMSYSNFLQWAFSGRLAQFTETLRWLGWRDDVPRLRPDQGILLYPPPWSEEGRDVSSAHRRVVPATELLHLYLEMRDQLGG